MVVHSGKRASQGAILQLLSTAVDELVSVRDTVEPALQIFGILRLARSQILVEARVPIVQFVRVLDWILCDVNVLGDGNRLSYTIVYSFTSRSALRATPGPLFTDMSEHT